MNEQVRPGNSVVRASGSGLIVTVDTSGIAGGGEDTCPRSHPPSDNPLIRAIRSTLSLNGSYTVPMICIRDPRKSYDDLIKF